MNESLSRELGLPEVGGTLEAFFVIDEERARSAIRPINPKIANHIVPLTFPEFWDFALREGYYRTDWRIYFTSNGPDRRYNDGSTEVRSGSFQEFLDALGEGREKLKYLQGAAFDGTYRKRIDRPFIKFLEVVSDNRQQTLQFSYWNGSRSFYRTLKLQAVEKAIERLKCVPAEAHDLMAQLEALK